MKDYLSKDPWKIIENGFHPENNKITESIFSIGNGYMGHRANFEEEFSGESMQGSYLAGIYYPDKTRVGWWKNGYPEYFAKVLNSVNWIGISISVGNDVVDLAEVKILSFYRELDMQHSLLKKNVRFETKEGFVFTIESERFCSWTSKELGVISYRLKSENYTGKVTFDSYLNFDVYNEDSNYDEQFWHHFESGVEGNLCFVKAQTKKTEFEVRALSHNEVVGSREAYRKSYHDEKKSGEKIDFTISQGEEIHLVKRVIIVSSFHIEKHLLQTTAMSLLNEQLKRRYAEIKSLHKDAWLQKWDASDIIIDGDVSAQQGIRFNIFHLHQTYSGDDARLNIGPKGFTGEKYGGSTYWDTEAYCVPFFLANSDQNVTRNLLMYRYRHLRKAIENAEKLGFTNGAALYPMVTMNGEECHNEWEITFEEIHRNGAIAYAIFDYTRYTGDDEYLLSEGLEVLVGIARFWAQRVNWSHDKSKYVILGVTGPNEYENNVNNNWYTNLMAVWCLKYCKDSLAKLKHRDSKRHESLLSKLNLDESETGKWSHIIGNMYYPFDKEKQIYLQQDGFLDKDIIPVSALEASSVPLNQNWSWDRILRSCYIKQADVLQGIYFFEEDYSRDDIKRQFNFYEPITVHESSLSPCVHSVLACRIGYFEKAYEMYLRTARLDLDDYNNDTEDGLHITSMAGTWMSIVKGFAGMKIIEDRINFDPYIPSNWESYFFKIKFRDNTISLKIDKSYVEIGHLYGEGLSVVLFGNVLDLKKASSIKVSKH